MSTVRRRNVDAADRPGKAEVVEYALSVFGKDHFKSVEAATYYQNWTGMLAPQKTEHGYIAAYPTDVNGRIASIDLNGDYGLFVVFAAIENRDRTDTNIPAAGDEPTFVEVGDAIGKATGKEVTTVQVRRRALTVR